MKMYFQCPKTLRFGFLMDSGRCCVSSLGSSVARTELEKWPTAVHALCAQNTRHGWGLFILLTRHLRVLRRGSNLPCPRLPRESKTRRDHPAPSSGTAFASFVLLAQRSYLAESLASPGTLRCQRSCSTVTLTCARSFVLFILYLFP